MKLIGWLMALLLIFMVGCNATFPAVTPATISDGKFNNLGVIDQLLDGTLIQFYGVGRFGMDNTVRNTIGMSKSTNMGKTWTPAVTVISDPVYTLVSPAGGVAPDGTIVIFYTRVDPTSIDMQFGTADAGYRYSTDNGTTFSNYITVPVPPHNYTQMYGRMIPIGNNKVLMGFTWGGDYGQFIEYVMISSDNGRTFGNPIPAWDTRYPQMSVLDWWTSQGKPTIMTWAHSETTYTYLGNNTILGLVRNDSDTYRIDQYAPRWVQIISLDNGLTWKYQGITWFDNPLRASAGWLSTFTAPDGRRVVEFVYQKFGATPVLRVIYGYADDLVNGVDGWNVSSRTNIATGIMGYPSVLHIGGTSRAIIRGTTGGNGMTSDIRFALLPVMKLWEK